MKTLLIASLLALSLPVMADVTESNKAEVIAEMKRAQASLGGDAVKFNILGSGFCQDVSHAMVSAVNSIDRGENKKETIALLNRLGFDHPDYARVTEVYQMTNKVIVSYKQDVIQVDAIPLEQNYYSSCEVLDDKNGLTRQNILTVFGLDK